MFPVSKEISPIRSNFSYYAETIDACKTATWLYQRGTLTPSEYDSVLYSDSASQSSKLLRLLECKKDAHIITLILEQSHLRKSGARLLSRETATAKDIDRSGHARPEELLASMTMKHRAASQPKPDSLQLNSSGTRAAVSNSEPNILHEDQSQDIDRPPSVLARGRGKEENLAENSDSLWPDRFSNRLPIAVTSPVTRSYRELQGQLAFPRSKRHIYQVQESQLDSPAAEKVAVFRRATEELESPKEEKHQQPEVRKMCT
jgi:hypothetical protein